MKENLIEKHKSQQESIYISYGKFAIQFEHLCKALRENILFALIKYGLTEQTITRILLADLTAYALVSKCRSIISFMYSDNPEGVKHIDPIFKACITIIEKRNLIIHGNWMIPMICDENTKNGVRYDIATGLKEKIIKTGIKTEVNKFNENDFNELTEKIKIAQNLISNIEYCYQFNKDLQSISKSKIDELYN